MKGVLLVNLGSPKSPTAKDVKPYLDEFLMDKYVIDLPYLLRAFVVRGIIIGLRNRAEKSAEAYKKIWWDEGSPLTVLSERLRKKVQDSVDVPVALAMRYGQPSIESGMRQLKEQGVNQMLVIPLYPQYAMATTQTIIEKAKTIQKRYFPDIELTYFPAFYDQKSYIKVLGDSVKESLYGFDYQKIVFSYHGVPERHIRKTTPSQTHQQFIVDEYCCEAKSEASTYCYRTHCFETTRAVAEYLNIPNDKILNTFQSRLSGDKWLEPYTDEVINNLPSKGIKKIAVITPAFVADCLETLEEIGMQAREDFIAHGGEEFVMIPCLNDRSDWAKIIADWIEQWKQN